MHFCKWVSYPTIKPVMILGVILFLVMSGKSSWVPSRIIGRGLSTTSRPGLKCGGLESKFERGPRTLTWVKRIGLACAWGTSEACIFRDTQLGTLILESPFLRDGTTWLRSGTVVRTDIWKRRKMVLIAQLVLENRTGSYAECWIMN
jgi:hypothetical protein